MARPDRAFRSAYACARNASSVEVGWSLNSAAPPSGRRRKSRAPAATGRNEFVGYWVIGRQNSTINPPADNVVSGHPALTWAATCLSTFSSLPLIANQRETRDVSARPGEAGNETSPDRIGNVREDNRNSAGHRPQGSHRERPTGDDEPPRSTRFAHRHKLIEMRGQDEPFNVFPCAE